MFYAAVTHLFDPLHDAWSSDRVRRGLAGVLVLVFLVTLALAGARYLEILPAFLDRFAPKSLFAAVDLAFTLVLVIEVVELVFTLPCSLSKAVGKQFEILCLILLRAAFKELQNFPAPIAVHGISTPLLHMLACAFGALAVFGLVLVFFRIQARATSRHSTRITGLRLYRLVAIKKAVALVLLAAFVLLGLRTIHHVLTGLPGTDFFHSFYTLLVFSDVLMVLVCHFIYPDFLSMFRNSGYALATLLIRLSLAADPFVNVALALGAGVFAVALAAACSWPPPKDDRTGLFPAKRAPKSSKPSSDSGKIQTEGADPART